MINTDTETISKDILFYVIQDWVKSRNIGFILHFYIINDIALSQIIVIFELKENSNIRTELKISQEEIYYNKDNLYAYLDTSLMDVLVNWLF